MHPYVLDQIGDNEDAYKSAKVKDEARNKKVRQLLELTALMHTILDDGDALYNSDDYDDIYAEDEIFND